MGAWHGDLAWHGLWPWGHGRGGRVALPVCEHIDACVLLQEYEEMRLKARALLAAVGKCDADCGRGSGQPASVDDSECWHH